MKLVTWRCLCDIRIAWEWVSYKEERRDRASNKWAMETDRGGWGGCHVMVSCGSFLSGLSNVIIEDVQRERGIYWQWQHFPNKDPFRLHFKCNKNHWLCISGWGELQVIFAKIISWSQMREMQNKQHTMGVPHHSSAAKKACTRTERRITNSTEGWWFHSLYFKEFGKPMIFLFRRIIAGIPE